MEGEVLSGLLKTISEFLFVSMNTHALLKQHGEGLFTCQIINIFVFTHWSCTRGFLENS